MILFLLNEEIIFTFIFLHDFIFIERILSSFYILLGCSKQLLENLVIMENPVTIETNGWK